MKFHNNQKVKIINGFYKTFSGRITGFKEVQEKTLNGFPIIRVIYDVSLKLGENDISEKIPEEYLTTTSIFSFKR